VSNMSNHPRKIRITAYLTTGEAIEGVPITLSNKAEESQWADAMRDPKNIKHLGLTQVNAFGDVDNIFINPTYITHLRVADVKE
jgi:hypothetical protein